MKTVTLIAPSILYSTRNEIKFIFHSLTGYGMTETSPVTHMSPIVNNKIGSCGEPVSRTRAKVVDVNTGEALGPGQEGELCIFGPQVMKGYYNNPKATEEMIDPNGWLHTGDIAVYDEDNQFYIVDRLKELIKVKGLQVNVDLLRFCWCSCMILFLLIRWRRQNWRTFFVVIHLSWT